MNESIDTNPDTARTIDEGFYPQQFRSPKEMRDQVGYPVIEGPVNGAWIGRLFDRLAAWMSP